jgi:hypothetical protein
LVQYRNGSKLRPQKEPHQSSALARREGLRARRDAHPHTYTVADPENIESYQETTAT